MRKLVEGWPECSNSDSRSRIGAGRLRSYFDPVIHLAYTSWFTTKIDLTSGSCGWSIWIGMLPFLQQDLCLLNQCLVRAISSTSCVSVSCHVYLLLSRFSDVLLGFEKGADVHGLASPYVSVYGPVEGELERSAVEGAVQR